METAAASSFYSGLLAIHTTVDVIGGNLVVADSAGSHAGNLTFTADGTSLTITDNNGDQIDLLDELDGGTGDGTSVVTVALSSFSTGTLDISMLGGADAVSFGGLQLLSNQSLTLDTGTDADSVSITGAIQTSGSGTVSLTANGGISMTAGSSISSDSGSITISANTAQTTTGNFSGLHLTGAQITCPAGHYCPAGT